MELNIKKEAETFAEAMQVTPEDFEDYLNYLADLIAVHNNRLDVVLAVWKRLQSDEPFARLVMAFFFTFSEDMLFMFAGEMHLRDTKGGVHWGHLNLL